MEIAIIGCGAIAHTHADVIKHLGFDVAAVCDCKKEKAELFKEKNMLSCAVYTDYLKMLDEVKPDGVHICTPHFEHAEMAIAALDRNINVLCEKPVCISDEQYRALKEAENRSAAQLGVCFQNRYLETNEKLKMLADTEGAKGIFAAVAWERGEKYYTGTDWRGRKKTEGGGVMMNQAIHTLDLALWMLGKPKSIIGSVVNNHLRGVIDEEDTAQFMIDFENGARATFYATTANAANTPVIISLVTGKNHYTSFGNKLFDNSGNPIAVNEKTNIIAKDYWGNGHLHLIRDFYAHISRGERFPIGAKEAYKAVKVVLELYNSGGNSREIDFSRL